MTNDNELAVQDGQDNLPDQAADLDNGLSEAQNRALLALVSTSTITEAARKADVGRTTIHRWMREPGFRRELMNLRNEAFSAAVGRAQRMADSSVKRLQDAIQDEKAPAASLISAIRLSLDFACRGMELDNLEFRLASLEEHAERNKHS